MLIALFGPSCAGKTTLGQQLADRLGLPFRSCGNEVRDRSRELGVPTDDLSMSEHASIDDATRGWSSAVDAGVVEGRYLDQVLSDQPASMTLIEITATPAVRAERWSQRFKRTQSEEEVSAFDAADERFRVRAYGSQARLVPAHSVETSGRTVEECLSELLEIHGLGKPG